jgi:hypothetical protein
MIIRFLTSGLWDFLRPLISQLLTDQGRAPRQIRQGSRGANGGDAAIRDRQRGDGAFQMVRQLMSEMGIQVKTYLINAAIEAAVARLRG